MKTEVRTNKKTGRRKASYNTSGQLDEQREKITCNQRNERERGRETEVEEVTLQTLAHRGSLEILREPRATLGWKEKTCILLRKWLKLPCNHLISIK